MDNNKIKKDDERSLKLSDENYSRVDRIKLIPNNPYYSMTKVPDSTDVLYGIENNDLNFNQMEQHSIRFNDPIKPEEQQEFIYSNTYVDLPIQKNFMAPIGPNCFKDTINLNNIKPIQSDLDNNSSEQMNFIIDNGSIDAGSIQDKIPSKIKEQLSSLENEVKYLRSLLSQNYKEENLGIISEILMNHFVISPRFNSIGKNSSFFTEMNGKTSSQGIKTLGKESSPEQFDSEEGNN